MKKLDFFFSKPIASSKKLIGITFLTVSLLCAVQEISAQTTLYYNGTGNLNNVASWGTSTNGTGGNTGITDFTGNNFSYIIQNATNIVFNSGTWTIGGTGTKVFLGNPTSATPNTPSAAITLTVNAGNTLISSGQFLEVSVPSNGNHKVIYKNTNVISFGTINDPNLELVFDGAVFSTSTSRIFGNVSLINGANIDMSSASPIFSSLSIDATSTLSGPLGASSNYIAIKSGGVVTINGTFKAGRSGSVLAPARGGLYTTGVPIPVVTATTLGTLLFQDATEPPNLILGSQSTIDYNRGTTSNAGTQGITPMAYANLTLSNAALAANKSFSVAGNITVSGTLTVNLLPTATITAATTQNLTLLPGARLVISSATAFPTPTSTGRFTLQSNVSGTALIGALASGASIVGNVTVQQFIPAGTRRYRFLSHPFSATEPLSELTDNIDITGNTAGTSGANGQIAGVGFTTTATNNPSAYFFNTATADGNATNDAGWRAIVDTTTANSNWGVGKGIRVLIRGTKGQAGTLDGTNASPAAVTLDMVGAVNTGNVSIPLVTGGSGSTADFNMVGNPYPSPVDIGAVLTAAGSNVANTFYLRNPQTGSYTTINPIPASYILPANAAFMIKANAAVSLNFTEANKSICTTCPTVFSSSSLKNNIQFKVMNNGDEVDNFSLNIGDNYTNDFDTKDAVKLLNDGLNIYFLSTDKQKVAANYCNLKTNIPLGISLPKNYGKQTYSIKVSGFNCDANTTLQLHDKLTNTYTTIKENFTYSLSVDPANVKSIGDNRLELVATKNQSIITNLVN